MDNNSLRFASGAVSGDGDVHLAGVHGRESLSRLFEFDLRIERVKPYTDDELDDLLKAPCAISLGPRKGDVVHGLLKSIEVLDRIDGSNAQYVATMVPNLWLLTLTRTSRLFQDTTVPDMIGKVLKPTAWAARTSTSGTTSRPRAPSASTSCNTRRATGTSSSAGSSTEGFFYWFEHGAEAEKLVVSDQNTDATAISDPESISYRGRNNLLSDVATVWDWSLLQRRIPARVALVDHNYRRPTAPMFASEKVDPARGFGTVFYYGEHFKDTGVGAALAKLRAERLLCERRTFRGATDCARFRVGHVFDLENHPEASNDGKYLITRIEHRVGFPVPPSPTPRATSGSPTGRSSRPSPSGSPSGPSASRPGPASTARCTRTSTRTRAATTRRLTPRAATRCACPTT